MVDTKIADTPTLKTIFEGVANKDKNMMTIKCTLVWLSILGESCFWGNFADRNRFESLVVLPDYEGFITMIYTYLNSFDFIRLAKIFVKNKDKVI